MEIFSDLDMVGRISMVLAGLVACALLVLVPMSFAKPSRIKSEDDGPDH